MKGLGVSLKQGLGHGPWGPDEMKRGVEMRTLQVGFRPRNLVWIFMIFALFLGGSALAAEPEQVVKERTAKVVEVLKKPATAARTKELEEAMNESLDFEELASRFLGEHWEVRTPEERVEFLGLLQRLLRSNYEDRLGERQLKEDFEIEYSPARIRRGRAFVRAQVRVRDRSEEVVYRLYQREDESWRIYDIVIDDISLEETYRDGYVPIIEEDGWEEFISLMKERVEEMEAK